MHKLYGMICGTLPILGLVLALQSTDAVAAIYYVDQNVGNDAYSGTAAQAGEQGVGPWQTLSRLMSAPIAPGDTVYLACGGTWNETLRLPVSGAAAAPIRVMPPTSNCATPPAIDGSLTIPSHMWSVHQGQIYRARLPIQLISNPTLNTSTIGWTHWSPQGDAVLALDPACAGHSVPCMGFTSGVGTSLAISNSFPLAGAADYSAGATIRAPAGTRIKVVLRRDGPTYEPLAPEQIFTASGSWQIISVVFRANQTVYNARLDIEVQGGRIKANVRDTFVRRTMSATALTSVFADGLAIRPAHHPNFGASGAAANSPFALATAGSTTTLDLASASLPAGATVVPGLAVSVKTHPWHLEERKIVAVAGARVTFNQATSYAAKSGTPYFLRGALWMLDSPGEWHFDPATGDLYVWMPDGTAPGNRVSGSSLALGIDLSGRASVEVSGVHVRRVGTAARLTMADAIRLQDMTMQDLASYGVEADNCTRCVVQNAIVQRTGLDAIRAIGSLTSGFTLQDSTIRESGAVERTDGWRTLPRPSRGAVDVGAYARILGNDLLSTSNSGVYAGVYSWISGNYVNRTCLYYNDCGGIYVNFFGNHSIVEGNVVHDIPGGMAGLPSFAPNQTVGIYLDNRASAVEVRGNTVAGAELGIQLHDAEYNIVASNLLYGNRRYQLWMQEQSRVNRANGDLHSNRVETNSLVPIAGGPAAAMESEVGDTRDFATYVGNHYSALFSQRVIGETWPTGSGSYTLSEWTATGQDAGARQTLPTGYASFLVNGTNIVPNGDLSNGFTDWTWWNQTGPFAQTALLQCSFGPCFRVTAGASPTLLSSPNFSVTEGQWYRVSFDALATVGNQPINVLVRRGGGGSASYEPLMTTAESFSGSTAWRRYSFLFRATKTVIANNPQTGELGARVDFERLQPGTSLTVARLEMVPMQPVQAALQLRLLLNPTRQNVAVACASADLAAGLCGKFVYMRDDSPVSWPAPVGPLSGAAIYTRDTSLIDSDGDGIADVQDSCAATPTGQAVNARGCALAQ